MYNKLVPFSAISFLIFGMTLLSHATTFLWINIVSFIIIIGGLLSLNLFYYKALKKLIKFDKDFFKHPLESL